MSIRMKEWGMMGQPSRGVHVPTDGLTGWADAARRMGEGFSAALMGGAKVLEERARVATMGELADFSERLKSIDHETRDELAEQEVQDWNYAWQAASAPKLAEAIEELSPEARAAGRKLADAYSARASVEAQRDFELRKIDRARSQWRARVDDAVEQGNVVQAQEWLQAGQGIFVPEEGMQEENEQAESRAHLARWQQDLEVEPLRGLGALAEAAEEALPRRQADARRLEQAKGVARRSARKQVLQDLEYCLQNELSPEPEFLDLAARAGVISREQAEAALQQAPAELSPAQLNHWVQRANECPEDEASAEQLRLAIATAPLPAQDKRRLLGRVEQSLRLPAQDRLLLSRSVQDLYRDGVLGCPEDAAAQRHLADLQQECLARLEQGGREGAAQWVHELRRLSDRWVCFEADSLS